LENPCKSRKTASFSAKIQQLVIYSPQVNLGYILFMSRLIHEEWDKNILTNVIMIICAQLFANPRSSSLNSKFEICFLSLLAARGKKKLMKLSGSEFIRGGG
jgi:hypothetical protein